MSLVLLSVILTFFLCTWISFSIMLTYHHRWVDLTKRLDLYEKRKRKLPYGLCTLTLAHH